MVAAAAMLSVTAAATPSHWTFTQEIQSLRPSPTNRHRPSGSPSSGPADLRRGTEIRAGAVSMAASAGDVEALKFNLLAVIKDQRRGLASQADVSANKRVISAVDRLVDAAAGNAAAANAAVNTAPERLSASWRMLWTTEKETLFILERAGLFGTAAGEVYQVIDVDKGTLNNVIEFPPAGAFVVDAAIAVANDVRVTFRFQAATLTTDRWTLPLPPFGSGWFDNVFVDRDIRIAKDSRGDVLVVERSPAPWMPPPGPAYRTES